MSHSISYSKFFAKMLQFDDNYPFVDGIFLLKLTTPTCPSLIAMSKGIQNLTDDIKYLEFCTPTSSTEFDSSCTFVFNSNDAFYYTLFFHQDQGSFELVIKSHQRCVYFFLNFLKDVMHAFYEVKSAYDPNNVFNLASSLIGSWPQKLENEMDVVYSKSLITVNFTNADFAYSHYRPSYFFQPKMYSKIFDHLISMKPILLVAPDSIRGCKSCFSAFCLVYPLRYVEPVVLWLRKGDPRYSEIVNSQKKSPYLVVATDDPSEISSKFDLVITCSEMNRVNTKADTQFQDHVRKIIVMIQHELSNLLNVNPYSDVLNVPWTNKNMEAIVSKFSFMPSMDTLRLFEKSKTVENWRERRSKTIRGNILQCADVKFEMFDKQQLTKVFIFLQSLKKSSCDDIHLSQIIKKHISIVSALLNRDDNVKNE